MTTDDNSQAPVDLSGHEPTIEVEIGKVIDSLKLQREEHEQQFYLAMLGFKRTYKDRIAELRRLAAKDVFPDEIGVLEPFSQFESFDEAIRFLEAVDCPRTALVKLNEKKFEMYMLGKWRWTATWNKDNEKYIKLGQALLQLHRTPLERAEDSLVSEGSGVVETHVTKDGRTYTGKKRGRKPKLNVGTLRYVMNR